MTVGEMIEFLSQFNSDTEIEFFMDSVDKLNDVRCYAEPSGEKDFPPYPMIVLDFENERRI